LHSRKASKIITRKDRQDNQFWRFFDYFRDIFGIIDKNGEKKKDKIQQKNTHKYLINSIK
jgi:hypothetical protein